MGHERDEPESAASGEEAGPMPPGPPVGRDPDTIPCEEVMEAMATGLPVRAVARRLGLRNREQLYRLRRRCGLI